MVIQFRCPFGIKGPVSAFIRDYIDKAVVAAKSAGKLGEHVEVTQTATRTAASTTPPNNPR